MRRVGMLLLVWLALGSGWSWGDEVRCQVRAEAEGEVRDAFALAPTLEEAVDLALESLCALTCVGLGEEEEVGVEQEGVATTGEVEAADDGGAVESCVERCVEVAVLMGTLCTQSGRVVMVDGAFDGDRE